MNYSPNISGGSLLTLNEDISPYSYGESNAIIDPEAADLETARTETEAVTATQQQTFYGTDETIKANFEQVTSNNPLFKTAAVSTKDKTTYDELLKVCANNSFKKGANPNPGTNDYMYGWSNDYDSKFPCVGFYSHTGSRSFKDGNAVKKYSILTTCKNADCDTLPGITEKLGVTHFTKFPTAEVDEVYGQKASNAQGRKLASAMGGLEEDYSEETQLQYVETGPLSDDESKMTKTQAMTSCSIKTIDGNHCDGLALSNDKYYFLYPTALNIIHRMVLQNKFIEK